ncbi:putative zinc finger protein 840 [Armigeres subalbatus]|uniref:putative zinc finger protein 840 n=1 Tax=Armigeres subalbatus TaxID=124917 RepID=UPI002ED38FA1
MSLPIKHEVPKDQCNVCGIEQLVDVLQEHRETYQIASVFRCSVCEGDYPSKETMWNHQEQHSITGLSGGLKYKVFEVHCAMYKCLLCADQRVYQGNLYWQHIHDSHEGCNECFRSKRLHTHELTNSKIGHTSNSSSDSKEHLNSYIKCECPICDEPLGNRNHLSKHIETNHGMFMCNVCIMVFSSGAELHGHDCSAQSKMDNSQHESKAGSRDGNHVDEYNDKPEIIDQAEFKQTEQVSIKMEISVEDTKLQSPNDDNTAEHNSTDSNYGKHDIVDNKTSLKTTSRLLSIQKESLQNQTLITPMDSHDPRQFDDDCGGYNDKLQKKRSIIKKCPICGLKFPSDTRMRYHKLISHTDPRYKCPKCPKTFHAKHVLDRHETTHLEQQNLTCTVCLETYRNELRLKRHKNSAHSVPCDLCELKFTSRTKMERHKRKQHKDRLPVDKWRRVKIPGQAPKIPVWTADQLQEAITSVVTQRCGISQASAQYKVPTGTLYDNILGKVNRMGVLEEVVLSPEEEAMVLNFACNMSLTTHSKRTKRSLSSILDFVSQFKCFQENGDRFKFGGIPGYQWWWAFCRKHSIDKPRSKSDGRKIAKLNERTKDGNELI